MSRRKRRAMSATLLPALRDELVTALRDIGRTAEAAALKDGDLMWVSPSMSELATFAAADLPEDIPAPTPTGSGIIYWAGGTGLAMPDRFTGERCQLSGVAFVATLTESSLWLPLTDDLPDAHTTVRDGFRSTRTAPLVAGPSGVDGGDEDWWVPQLEALAQRVAVTQRLAEMPTIARRGRMRLPGPPMPGRPDLPSIITTITLREGIHAPTGQHKPTESSGRTLTTRHLVRGHWRNQPCGPNRSERKLLYVPPCIRGPEGAPLVIKPAVKIWRR